MPRLYIFAEGQTEQTYGDTVLKEHLAAFGVYVQGPILIAHARRTRHVHRGGGRRYLPMKNDILRFLRQEKGRDVYFTTMIDLYALPVDFPGTDEAEELRHLPYDRVSKLEEHFAADIDDPHGQSISVHSLTFSCTSSRRFCFVVRRRSLRSSEIVGNRSSG